MTRFLSLAIAAWALSAYAAAPKPVSSIRFSARSGTDVDQPAKGFSGPVMGLFTNREGSKVHAVTGIPGSALISKEIVLPEGVGRMFLAPGQRWAVAEMNDGSGLAVLSIQEDAGLGSPRPVPNSLGQVDLIAFSTNGQHAAVYSRSASKLQVLSFNDSSDSQIGEWLVTELTPILLAIDDAGNTPIAATENGVYLVSNDHGVQMVYSGKPSFAEYGARSSTLYIGDSESLRVTTLDDVTNIHDTRVLASTLPSIGIFARMSPDGRYLYVVTNDNRALRIDLSEDRAYEIDLPTRPGLLQRLRHSDSYLVSAEPTAPAWLLSGGEERFKVSFAAPEPPSVDSTHSEEGELR